MLIGLWKERLSGVYSGGNGPVEFWGIIIQQIHIKTLLILLFKIIQKLIFPRIVNDVVNNAWGQLHRHDFE